MVFGQDAFVGSGAEAAVLEVPDVDAYELVIAVASGSIGYQEAVARLTARH